MADATSADCCQTLEQLEQEELQVRAQWEVEDEGLSEAERELLMLSAGRAEVLAEWAARREELLNKAVAAALDGPQPEAPTAASAPAPAAPSPPKAPAPAKASNNGRSSAVPPSLLRPDPATARPPPLLSHPLPGQPGAAPSQQQSAAAPPAGGKSEDNLIDLRLRWCRAKIAKDYSLADQLRLQLDAAGITVNNQWWKDMSLNLTPNFDPPVKRPRGPATAESCKLEIIQAAAARRTAEARVQAARSEQAAARAAAAAAAEKSRLADEVVTHHERELQRARERETMARAAAEELAREAPPPAPAPQPAAAASRPAQPPAPAAAPAPAPPVASRAGAGWVPSLGARVELHGLQQMANLNGRVGTVTEVREDVQRAVVDLGDRRLGILLTRLRPATSPETGTASTADAPLDTNVSQAPSGDMAVDSNVDRGRGRAPSGAARVARGAHLDQSPGNPITDGAEVEDDGGREGASAAGPSRRGRGLWRPRGLPGGRAGG
eukprot:TRINITY_DN23256_c0_g1_i1.p1 TRINITY_DN23256_c0_g1~~TRINITY_DN23256_c0_g1_i1.p1  ORF type:complete len:531 (+),score=120.65 TRINITY_DN23256_c0_g1_i1:110-1594(+)